MAKRKISPKVIRPSHELAEIINMIKAKYILEGKTPPSATAITRYLVKNVDKNKVLNEFQIRL